MVKPNFKGICDECPYEKMTIVFNEHDRFYDFYVCEHFRACARMKEIIEKRREKEEE